MAAVVYESKVSDGIRFVKWRVRLLAGFLRRCVRDSLSRTDGEDNRQTDVL